MTLRPPRILRPAQGEDFNPLREEILQEQASALGHATRRLEAALSKLSELRAAGSGDRDALDQVLDAAGEAAWNLVVQRESCGLRNSEAVLRQYQVPPEVRLRMGVSAKRET